MLRPLRNHWHGLEKLINELLTNPFIGEKNMGNKFLSWLSHAEQAFVKGITVILHIAENEGEVAVAIFAPELGPLFNSTVAAVVISPWPTSSAKARLTSPVRSICRRISTRELQFACSSC